MTITQTKSDIAVCCGHELCQYCVIFCHHTVDYDSVTDYTQQFSPVRSLPCEKLNSVKSSYHYLSDHDDKC